MTISPISESHLDTVSTGSDSDNLGKLITDPVAIAPCTDCIQERYLSLNAKSSATWITT